MPVPWAISAKAQNAVSNIMTATGVAVIDAPTRGRRRTQQEHDALLDELTSLRAALVQKDELLEHKDELLRQKHEELQAYMRTHAAYSVGSNTA